MSLLLDATQDRAPAVAMPASRLPTPPTDAEVGQYEHRDIGVIIGMSLLSIGCLAVSQLEFVHLQTWLYVILPSLLFTVAYYLISMVVTIGSRNFDLAAHRDLVESWCPLDYPAVDVWLPICNEGLDVLENSWHYVAAMRDRYPGVVEVYVLDDGVSYDAELMAGECGFRYSVRPNPGWLKKAGNLHHGYEISRNDYIAIFDADFCPRADFLDQLVPYLDTDPDLGIVQSPQFFRAGRHQTWMERGAAAVQELFYRMVQTSRDRLGGAICVGSCAVYRRTALDAIGGTALIEHSEDVHTGFDVRRAGWGLRYLPVILATGLCPPDADSFLTQQYRWCMGSLSLMTSRKFWSTRLPLPARLCYVSGFFYYLHTAVFVLVTPAIPLILVFAEPSHVVISNYVWILPSTAYALIVFPLWHRVRFGPSALMAKYLYGWAHLFAVLDFATGRRRSWQVTGGIGAKADTDRIWTAIIVFGSVTSIAWLEGAAVRAHRYGFHNWALFELSGVLYAGIFAMAVLCRLQRGTR